MAKALNARPPRTCRGDVAKRLASRPLTAEDIDETLRALENVFPGTMQAMAGDPCTCPRRDNAELAGTGYAWVSGDCPVHAADYLV